MKKTLISKENNEGKFTLEFTPEEFEEAVVKVYQRNKDQFELPGFRKGKAPRKVIESHYGNEIFWEDAINDLLSTGYPEALAEFELEAIDSPKPEFDELKPGESFTVTFTVPLYPTVEVKDYKGVEVEQVEPEVSDADVDAELEALRKRNARMDNVDRAVEDGDTVILDYAGFVGDNQFEGGTAERQELKIGSGMFIPGFEEQLIGVKSGEEKDVVVTFPEEYQAEDLAGKEATFHCTVHEIKEEILPELDDEFAKDVSEFDTLDELKDSIRKNLEETAEKQAESLAKDQVIEKVYEINKVEVPDVMVEDEIDRTINELAQQMQYQGFSLEQYLQIMGKNMQELRDELRADATKKVATRVVLMSIVEAENIEATEEDVEKELEEIAKLYKTDVEQLRAMLGVENMTYFMKDIQLKKAIDMLYDNAKITKVKPSEKKAEEAEEKAE